MSSELSPMFAAVELIPDATDEQWADVTQMLAECAPDLLPMLGVES